MDLSGRAICQENMPTSSLLPSADYIHAEDSVTHGMRSRVHIFLVTKFMEESVPRRYEAEKEVFGGVGIRRFKFLRSVHWMYCRFAESSSKSNDSLCHAGC